MAENRSSVVMYQLDGAIATITINRPESFNAINHEVLKELEETLQMLEEKDEVRILVITGAGMKAFAAGADIHHMNSLDAKETESFIKMGQSVMNQVANSKKITIAAINGHALGGGFELALACDLRIAVQHARLGLPEVSLGIIPGWGGTQRLAKLVGPATAKEWILTGGQMDAETAERLGIVQQVVTSEELMDACQELAAKILGNAPLAVRLAKEAIDISMEKPIDEGLSIEADYFVQCFQTEDRQEGFAAFFEKRKPSFKG